MITKVSVGEKAARINQFPQRRLLRQLRKREAPPPLSIPAKAGISSRVSGKPRSGMVACRRMRLSPQRFLPTQEWKRRREWKRGARVKRAAGAETAAGMEKKSGDGRGSENEKGSGD